MNKELELWQFIAGRLNRGENVMLLIVAESSGSSPGRAGYKMAVTADGELCGSIGGGVMEVNLVRQSLGILSVPPAVAGGSTSLARVQVHRKEVEDSSGMICSGQQTVILTLLASDESKTVKHIVKSLQRNLGYILKIRPRSFGFAFKGPSFLEVKATRLTSEPDGDFLYEEKLGRYHDLFIIGGGHCALALSELMSKLDFRISIYDDRPELNTVDKNKFADKISIIDSYEKISEHIVEGEDSYVVVMTLGYASDKVVIKQLCDRNFKYFGVLGSKAKMATLMKELKNELKNEGILPERLDRIRAPIGLPIKSRTPEEIAVSIAAEIIAVKNSTQRII